MEYSKGEWKRSKQGWLIRTNDERICKVNHTAGENRQDEIAEGNASLIIQSPKMFEELVQLIRRVVKETHLILILKLVHLE